MFIYAIWFNGNVIYVGKTSDLAKRYLSHVNCVLNLNNKKTPQKKDKYLYMYNNLSTDVFPIMMVLEVCASYRSEAFWIGHFSETFKLFNINNKTTPHPGFEKCSKRFFNEEINSFKTKAKKFIENFEFFNYYDEVGENITFFCPIVNKIIFCQ